MISSIQWLNSNSCCSHSCDSPPKPCVLTAALFGYRIPSIVERAEPAQPLKERAWTWITSFSFINYFYENRLLNDVKYKLDGSPSTPKKILKFDESFVALRAVLKWFKEPDSDRLPTRIKCFVEHLQVHNYLKFDTNEIPIEQLELFLEQLESFIGKMKRTGFYDASKELSVLEPFLAPELLYAQIKSDLPEFTEQEIINCEMLSKDDSIVSEADFLKAYKFFVKLIHNPEKVEKFTSFSNPFSNEPFMVNGRIYTHSSPSFKELIGKLHPKKESKVYFFASRFKEMHEGLQKFGGLKAIREHLSKGTLGIEESCVIGVLSLFLTPYVDRLSKNDLTSEDEKNLFLLIKQFPYQPSFNPCYNLRLWTELESQLEMVKALRQQWQASKTITLEQLHLYLKVTDLTAQYQDFLNKNGTWPCEIVNELKEWIPLLPSESFGLRDIVEKHTASDFNKLISKIENAVSQNEITDENRLTFKEFYFFKAMSKQVKFFKNYLNLDYKNLFENYKLVLLNVKDDLCIRVCLFCKDPDQKSEDESPKSLWKRIVDFAINFFQNLCPYGHTNFYVVDNSSHSAHGLSHGIYHRSISGHYNPAIETLDINVERLMPKNIDKNKIEDFKKQYFGNLQALIENENPGLNYPSNPFKRIMKGIFDFRWAQPVECYLQQKNQIRELFCSEFVTQAIIEAQIQTCKSMDLDPPATLSFFGFKTMEGMTPGQMRSIFVRERILTPVANPLS